MQTVLSILSTTPSRWLSLAENVPAELLLREPLVGEWSAVECLAHMIDTERYVFPVRVRAFLAGLDFPAFNPENQGTKIDAHTSPLKLVTLFSQLRKESLSLLSSLTPADYPRMANHAELGPVSLEQMLNEWAGHDLDHTIQAERAIMQPFIHACGPWQKYFSANFMK